MQLALAILLLFVRCTLAQTALVTVSWSWPNMILDPGLSFNVYQTTNLTPPVEWTLLTNVVATQVTLPVLKQAQFFTATTVDNSNFWKESDFASPPAVIPTGPPLSPQNLSIAAGGPIAKVTPKLLSPKAK